MPDFTQPTSIVLPLSVHSRSRYACAAEKRAINALGTPAAVTWVSGLAEYIPFSIPWPYPVCRVAWVNGSTITSTNVDFGIFNVDGVQDL